MATLIQQVLNGISAGMTYALAALGLTLVFGVLHLVNFAHGELYMIGALVVVFLADAMGVPYMLSLAGAPLAVALLALLVDRVAIRPVASRPDGLSAVILATFAVSLLILHTTMLTVGAAPKRIDGLTGIISVAGATLSNQRLFVILVGFALIMGTHLFLNRTSLGRQLRAVAQDPYGAQAVGINVQKIRSITFALAGALAGLAGGLMVPISLFTPHMGAAVLIKAFVCVVVGGMGNVWGAVLCGLALGILEAVLGSYLEYGFALSLIYAAMIGLLLIRTPASFDERR